MNNTIRISVRYLIEFVLKKGSIDDRYFSKTRAIEGTYAHKKLQKSNEDFYKNYQKEVHLKYDFNQVGIPVIVEGRADGIIIENQETYIEEIKSTMKELYYIDESYNELHWGQVKFYAYIYMKINKLSKVTLLLSYFQLQTEEVKTFNKLFIFKESEEYVMQILEGYLKFIKKREIYLKFRNDSINKLKFPFEKYRSGQREMSVAWYNTIKERDSIYIQAPTGIGKTISTVFPSLKALANNMGEKIFYLTAKTITRVVVEDGIRLLKDNGLYINTITLRAKEKVCLNDKVSCNPHDCQYACGYYDKINNIIYKWMSKSIEFSQEIIKNIAKEEKVCPFELSLDLSCWCDVIIGDYNYAFDSSVRLSRFFDEGLNKNLLLIDEAHNLVDRAREMYSASISKGEILDISRKLKNTSIKVSKALSIINKRLIEIRHESDELEEKSFYKKEEYSDLYKHLKTFIGFCDEYLTNSKDDKHYDEVRDLYFKIREFLSVAELYKENAYVTVVECSGSDVTVKISCINPSENIGKIVNGAYAAVLFSATLTPISYYIDLLGGGDESYRLTLSSPFNPQNLKVDILPINMRYSYRNLNVKLVVKGINSLIKFKEGNYMVFAPSFEYMEKLHDNYVEEYGDINVIIQKEGMSEDERNEFLLNFNEGKQCIAFCVIGGVFSEGIDLPGEKLIGVVIIGVGFPKICYDRDIIKEFFGSNGFDYAYIYPGINKIMQAAGRVIRTENDEGRVLLIDDRYLNRKYKSLLPKEWYNK